MRFAALAVILVAGAGCSASSGPAQSTTTSATVRQTTSTTTTTTATTITTTEVSPAAISIPEPLVGIETTTISLDGRELLVAVADTPQLRRRGLMFVDDLGDLDGMLFVFDNDTTSGFWMKNTLLPLDIAFFDVAGRFVDGFGMEPCESDSCPTYNPGGSYRYALEMAAGTMPSDPQVLDVGVS